MAGKSNKNGKTRAFTSVNYRTARLAREKQKREIEQQKKEKVIFVLFVVIILVMILFAILIFKNILSGDGEDVPGESETVETSTDPTEKNDITDVTTPSVYRDETLMKEDIYKLGNLLLIDSSHPYKKPAQDPDYPLAKDSRTPTGSGSSFYLEDMYHTQLEPTTHAALDALGVALYKESNNNDLCIASNGGYVKDASDDHATGRAIDVLAMPENGVFLSLDDEKVSAKFDWFRKNYYKYGFVLSSDSGCEATYHLLYVGAPHAYYMYKNELSLKGYLELIKTKHTYGAKDQSPLTFTADDGAQYQVYYVAAVGDYIKVPVPADKDYTISGNNSDGFVVTVTLG